LKIPARRRINREQEVLELISKLPVQMRENEKDETRSNHLSLGFAPRWQCQKQRLAPLQTLAVYTNVGY
jgi:hypothetical protein